MTDLSAPSAALDVLRDKLAGIPLARLDGGNGSAVVEYAAIATAQQRAQGDAIVAGFDWTLSAERQAEAAAAANEGAIRSNLANALLGINTAISQNTGMIVTAQTYLPGADTATAAQVRTQVKALTQAFIQLAQNQNAGLANQRGVVRLLTKQLRSADALKV